jgi:hypothetical protein
LGRHRCNSEKEVKGLMLTRIILIRNTELSREVKNLI